MLRIDGSWQLYHSPHPSLHLRSLFTRLQCYCSHLTSSSLHSSLPQSRGGGGGAGARPLGPPPAAGDGPRRWGEERGRSGGGTGGGWASSLRGDGVRGWGAAGGGRLTAGDFDNGGGGGWGTGGCKVVVWLLFNLNCSHVPFTLHSSTNQSPPPLPWSLPQGSLPSHDRIHAHVMAVPAPEAYLAHWPLRHVACRGDAVAVAGCRGVAGKWVGGWLCRWLAGTDEASLYSPQLLCSPTA